MEKEVHKHEWWLPYIEEYLNSDISISMKDYAEAKGLSMKALSYHVRKERRERIAQSGTEIIPVTVTAPSKILDVSINGINVAGDPDTIRKILGVKQ